MCGITLTAMNRVEEGDILVASVFVKDPGLALTPKMCPDQSQAFKEVNTRNSQAFTVFTGVHSTPLVHIPGTMGLWA